MFEEEKRGQRSSPPKKQDLEMRRAEKEDFGIIHVQIGRCGNELGCKFLDQIASEDAVFQEGEEALAGLEHSCYFTSGYIKSTPRALIIDSEQETMDEVRSSSIGQHYTQENFIFSNHPTKSNWAKGHYSQSNLLLPHIQDALRKEAEKLNHFEFQIFHSMAGGTGGGLSANVLSLIQDQYPGNCVQCFSVFPSTKVSDSVFEPYNAALSLSSVIQYAQICHVFDNEALYEINFRTLGKGIPNYADLNKIACKSMIGISMPYRRLEVMQPVRGMVEQFGNPANSRMHFLVNGYKEKAEDVAEDYDYDFILCDCDETQEAYKKLEASIAKDRYYMRNSRIIIDMLKRIDSQFTAAFRLKAYLYKYTGEGMEEMDFVEAQADMNDLIAEYNTYHE
jgi:hypothetical protein